MSPRPHIARAFVTCCALLLLVACSSQAPAPATAAPTVTPAPTATTPGTPGQSASPGQGGHGVSTPEPSPTETPGPSATPSPTLPPPPPGEPDTAVPATPPPGWVDHPRAPVRRAPTGKLHKSTTTRTNIVALMVDDLPQMDDRVWSRLPTIRRLFLQQGLQFTNYYGNDPFCCPGRSNFLTGQYTDHHGVYTNDATLLNPTETLATELQSVGYYTFISGKYLNGTANLRVKQPPGWTQSAIYSGGYYRYDDWVNGVMDFHDSDTNDFSVDVFANQALQFMRDAPADKPIFAFLTPYSVHAGAGQNGASSNLLPVAAPRYLKDPRCANVAPWDPPNYAEADVSDKPAYIQNEPPQIARGDPRFAHGWPLVPVCRSLMAVDDELARVEAELKAEGRLNNTLFVLTADNGMTFGAHRWPKKNVPYATQLPLFVSWVNGRGRTRGTNAAFISNVDMAPTLCQLAGCTMGPYPDGEQTADGQSALGLIATNTRQGGKYASAVPIRQALYTEHRSGLYGIPRWRAIVTTPSNPLGRWHYVEYQTGERELYDLSTDPWEMNNLASNPAYAPVEARLAVELAAFVTNVNPNVP